MRYNFTCTNLVLQRKKVTLVGFFYLHSGFNYESIFGRHFSMFIIYVQTSKFTTHKAVSGGLKESTACPIQAAGERY